MNTTVSLQIPEGEQLAAKKIAEQAGLITEGLYLKLIHEGLMAYQQRLYFENLKNLSESIKIENVLSLLDKAPDIEPFFEDKIS